MCPAAARAQTAPDPTADARFVDARRAFEEGIEAVRVGRPVDAVPAFERSFALRPSAVVAVNLGLVLRGVGRLADARRWYERFLELAGEADLARHAVTVRAHLAEIDRRLAWVALGVVEPPGAVVRLDEQPLEAAAEPRRVDPGAHTLLARASGYREHRQTLVLAEGERRALALRLDPLPRDRAITRQWWFWTGMGVIVVGTVTAIVLATLPPSLPPFSGETFNVTP
ncbi:MAG: hypothetical protein U0325_33145 [Polyangiales bacterium]